MSLSENEIIGFIMTNKLKIIPAGFSLLTEKQFAFVLNEPKRETLIIRLPTDMKKTLEKIAKSQGITASTLVRMWLIEKIKQTCYNSK